MKRNAIKYKNASLFQGCCVSSSSLLWMIITLFIFFIFLATLGLLATWLLCAYYRRKSRKQVEKELQRRQDNKNQLKLDMFRKKQLDLQMLAAMRNAKISSKDNLRFQEPMTPQMSYVPYVRSSGSEQHPRLLNSGSPSLTQTIPPNTETNKSAKKIEDLQLLPASTARSPSQKKEKNRELSNKRNNEAEVENKEDPEIQQDKADIRTFNNNRLDKQEREKSKKKRKSKMKEETKNTRKSSDQKYSQSVPMLQRYQHQIPPDNVHEWIRRIARSTSPIPYFSPNKRILLIPEPSTEDLNDKNKEENEENDHTLGEIGTSTPKQSTDSPSHTNAGEVETDVEISTETKEQSTPTAPTFPTPVSASVNTPPSSAFLDDQPYWRKESKQQKCLKIGTNSNISERAKEKIFWNLPDKRAEERLNRSLENPRLYTIPTVHSRMSFNREEQPVDVIRRMSHQP